MATRAFNQTILPLRSEAALKLGRPAEGLPLAVSFGRLLKRYRRAAGLTQEALAERAGYSTTYLSKLERGERTPLAFTIAALADALGIAQNERAALERADQRTAAALRTQAQPSVSTPSSLLSPLVGRAAEQARLSAHLAGEGPPLLLIMGEPGIGKTRLLEEAARQGARQGWCVLEGHSHRQSRQEVYAPLLGAVACHLARHSLTEQRLALQRCAWLLHLLPELVEVTGLTLPPWTLSAASERRLLFAAVRRFLDHSAGPAGTLLILDDLHWAGAEALDLLTSLLHAEAHHPLRVIGTYRSTEAQVADPLRHLVADLAREGNLQRMEVGPLAPGEAITLLRLLLQGSQIEGHLTLFKTILERTEGVPAFLVSYAQAIRTGGLVDTLREPIPWQLAETIRQRVSALSEEAQYLLGVVAVAGNEARRPLLLALASQLEWGKREVLIALEHACQARLLVEVAPDAYRFARELIREVVTADMSATRRAILHQQVAELLEQSTAEAPVEAVADHYRQARLHEHALVYLERAGDRAQAAFANEQAERYYREWLESLLQLGRTSETAAAREKLGRVLGARGHYLEALALFEEALATYRAQNDLDGQARIRVSIK